MIFNGISLARCSPTSARLLPVRELYGCGRLPMEDALGRHLVHAPHHSATIPLFAILAIPNLFVVETVDSAKKASTLDKACAAAARPEPLRVFLQVNTSGEECKCAHYATTGLMLERSKKKDHSIRDFSRSYSSLSFLCDYSKEWHATWRILRSRSTCHLQLPSPQACRANDHWVAQSRLGEWGESRL